MNWNECDWHGVWVSDISSPGSYGRIAHLDYDPDFPQAPIAFWVRWDVYAKGDKRASASRNDVRSLKLLPVEPEPWYV